MSKAKPELFVREYVTRSGKRIWEIGQTNYSHTLKADDYELKKFIDDATEALNDGSSQD